jgi:hypothetical protein
MITSRINKDEHYSYTPIKDINNFLLISIIPIASIELKQEVVNLRLIGIKRSRRKLFSWLGKNNRQRNPEDKSIIRGVKNNYFRKRCQHYSASDGFSCKMKPTLEYIMANNGGATNQERTKEYSKLLFRIIT